jgi:hypothetical protein
VSTLEALVPLKGLGDIQQVHKRQGPAKGMPIMDRCPHSWGRGSNSHVRRRSLGSDSGKLLRARPWLKAVPGWGGYCALISFGDCPSAAFPQAGL